MRTFTLFLCLFFALPVAGQAQVASKTSIERAGDGKGNLETSLLPEGFGGAVAISGRLAFVAETKSSFEPTSVTVFHRDSTTEVWSQDGPPLTSPGGVVEDGFGTVIDADGHRVIVGAPDANGGKGVAYIFARQSPGVWIQEGAVQSEKVSGSWYARYTISISGDYAIVGEGVFNGSTNGRAHIYKYDSGSWVADTTLPHVDTGDRFGFSAAISGSRVAVGAYYWAADVNTVRVGKVHVYERSGNTWSRTHGLTLPDSMSYDQFGYAVDVDGDRIAVGNRSFNARPQGYRIFEYDAASWVLRDSVESLGYYAIDLDSATVASGIGAASQVAITSADGGSGSWSAEDILNGAGPPSGDNFGYDVGVDGDYAIVGKPADFVGANDAYIFMRQPDSTWLQVAHFTGTGTPTSSVAGSSVSCSGGMATIPSGPSFGCKDIDLQSYLNRSDLLATGNMSDIWGWTDPVTGHEYALVTHGGGTTFVDVTDPDSAIVVGVLPLHVGTYNSSWRDVKTYGDYAFVVADNAGPQGIQVFDLKELRLAQGLPSAAPKSARETTALPVTFSESAYYGKFSRAHNIAINDSSATAFIVGSDLCGGGIHMVDISNPMAPDSTGCYADTSTGRYNDGYTHDIQCVKYHGPDATYSGREICFGANETALLITDVTDNANPATVGKGSYPDYAYVHQGWLTEDHRYFVLDDELDEAGGQATNTRTLFFDVTDLSDPVVDYEYSGSTAAIDHNQYVLGSYLYQAQYKSGLRIVDISGITEAPHGASKNSIVTPTEVAFFDTYPASDNTSFAGAWSVYPYFASGNVVVSSMGEGMFVLTPQIVQTEVDLTLFLEGPYVVGDDSMAISPSFQSVVPIGNPYQDSTFHASPLELNVPDTVLTLPDRTLDWVQVELRTGTAKNTAVMTRSAILLRSGLIVDPNGNPLSFPGVDPGSYYVVVRHRNHLSVMTASAVDLSSGSGSWNFTTADTQAFGPNPMKALGDGKWGLFAGEASLDGINSVGDFNAWLIDTKASSTGYLLPDFRMDGQVTVSDFNLWLTNTKASAASQVPE